jgi:hypothetical protein
LNRIAKALKAIYNYLFLPKILLKCHNLKQMKCIIPPELDQLKKIASGPELLVGRSELSCSVLRSPSGSVSGVLVAGGHHPDLGILNSTELLDLSR